MDSTDTPATAPTTPSDNGAAGFPPIGVAPGISTFSPGIDTPPATGAATSSSGTGTAAVPAPPPAPTGTTRNGAAALPTMAQPGTGASGVGASDSGISGASGARLGTSSVTFGGPQVDLQPAYGSAMRDSGAGNNGVPTYNNAPTTLGGPINGTANAYSAALPYGAAPGQGTSAKRGSQGANTFYTQQPLGGAPNTRDQTSTFSSRNGYNAQGIYNGTAVQPGNGYGSGSTYATTGRPIGGLLSTNVDATGPLRPYVPLNTGTTGRPNSGYGIPNGSRSTHMDGRGIQRVD